MSRTLSLVSWSLLNLLCALVSWNLDAGEHGGSLNIGRLSTNFNLNRPASSCNWKRMLFLHQHVVGEQFAEEDGGQTVSGMNFSELFSHCIVCKEVLRTSLIVWMYCWAGLWQSDNESNNIVALPRNVCLHVTPSLLVWVRVSGKCLDAHDQFVHDS
jgi:hypothetical protein